VHESHVFLSSWRDFTIWLISWGVSFTLMTCFTWVLCCQWYL